MTIVHIRAAVASHSGITLYLRDGETMELSSKSHLVNEIMQEIAGPLSRRKLVKLNLAQYSAHAQIERKTGGFIRFAIEKAKSFLGVTERSGGMLGDRILKNNETVAAYVGDKRIPGAQALTAQIERAAFTKDCKGFRLFMERLAAVIDERGHTVQELLNFMERADLPIANDGSIVAYKTLRRAPAFDQSGDVFVDIHSETVRQKLGSRVSMLMENVDENRRIQCSTGLHIARRGYLKSYFGDVLTLVKINPEDVICVPIGEPDKMRVMAYHIVAMLPAEAVSLVRQDKAMTSDKNAARILADVIAGDHVGVLEEVRIGERKKDAKSNYDKEIVIEQSIENTPFLGGGQSGLAAALDDETEEVKIDIRGLNRKIEEASKAKKSKPKKSAPVDPAPKQKDPDISRREAALAAVLAGMSQREAAKQFKVCAKTLRKMIQAYKEK